MTAENKASLINTKDKIPSSNSIRCVYSDDPRKGTEKIPVKAMDPKKISTVNIARINSRKSFWLIMEFKRCEPENENS